MDWGLFSTIVGCAIAIVGFIYQIVRHFKEDISKRIELQDERIFQLATGKSLREAMLEAKKISDERNKA